MLDGEIPSGCPSRVKEGGEKVGTFNIGVGMYGDFAAKEPKFAAEVGLVALGRLLNGGAMTLKSRWSRMPSVISWARHRASARSIGPSNTRLGQPDGISPLRMAEMLEVDKAGPRVRR